LAAKLLYKVAKVHEFQENYQEALDVYSEKLRLVNLPEKQNTLDAIVALHDIVKLRHTINHLNQAIDTFKQLLSVIKIILN